MELSGSVFKPEFIPDINTESSLLGLGALESSLPLFLRSVRLGEDIRELDATGLPVKELAEELELHPDVEDF